MHGGKLWKQHPGVRTGDQLLFRERAADALKSAFGTWTLLGLIVGVITAWLLWVRDPGELHLNLGLSFLASVQGVILQIAANRGDRIGAEVAAHTRANTDTLLGHDERLLGLNEQQLELLKAQEWQGHLLRALADELVPGLAEGLGEPDAEQPEADSGEDGGQ